MPNRCAAACSGAVFRELVLVAAAAAVYGAVRAVTEGSIEDATANARAIVDVEKSLGIAWEQAVQAVVVPHAALVTFANWVYIFGHWPVIVASAVVLYRHRRGAYRRLRNAILLSGAIGFFFFAMLPAAPPRLLHAVAVDTVAQRSTAYRALQPPSLTNQLAAMPSLHFGWNLLVGIVLFGATTSVAVRVFAVATPPAMAFAVIATGNHFVLDVVVALILVLSALGVVAAAEHRVPTLDDDDSELRDRSPLRQRPRTPSLGHR